MFFICLKPKYDCLKVAWAWYWPPAWRSRCGRYTVWWRRWCLWWWRLSPCCSAACRWPPVCWPLSLPWSPWSWSLPCRSVIRTATLGRWGAEWWAASGPHLLHHHFASLETVQRHVLLRHSLLQLKMLCSSWITCLERGRI